MNNIPKFITTTSGAHLNVSTICSAVVELFRGSFHAKFTLGLMGLATGVWLSGVFCIIRCRRHRAMRASGLELSACVMAAAALRVAALALTALAPRTPICCAAMSASAVLSTTLTFTAIALKVCGSCR